MEVKLRLQRAGKTASKRYNYRIVAISKTDKRDGRFLDLLGYYDPAKKPASVSINREKLDKWLKKGAQMSDTVKSIAKKLK
jgi:small subunit ribosomal protein S16